LLIEFKFFFFVQPTDNELITLEVIHRYVELLDKYFGSVSHNHYFYALLRYMQCRRK
jgi:hypothetical protein